MTDLSALAERIEAAERKGFTSGYLLAVANILHTHDEPTIAADVLNELGETEGVIKRCGLTDFDAKPLRKLFRDISRRARSQGGTDHG